MLYESFEYRDRKYVYFLKKGYPVRLWSERTAGVVDVRTIVYTRRRVSARRVSPSWMSRRGTAAGGA